MPDSEVFQEFIEIFESFARVILVALFTIQQDGPHPRCLASADIPLQVVADKYAVVGPPVQRRRSKPENLGCRFAPANVTAKDDFIDALCQAQALQLDPPAIRRTSPG